MGGNVNASARENVEQMPTIARHVTRQRAGSDILMQIVARVVNLALGALVTALLVRALGQSLYGQWSTTLVALSLIGYFTAYAIETVAVREAAREPEQEFEWLGSVVTARFLLLAPVMISAAIIVVLLHESEEMLIAGLIMVLAMPFGGFSAMALVFRLRVDNRVPMLVLTVRSLLWGGAVLFVFLKGGGMIELSIALVVSNLIGNGVQILAARKVIGRWVRPTRVHVRQLLKAAVPVGISGLLVMAYGRIDQVIVFLIQGSAAAGLYGSVYMLLESAHFVPGSILTTMAPVMAAAWPRDPSRLRRSARMTLELLCVGSFGALAFAIVAAEPVVEVVFGSEFAEAASILPVLAGAFVLMSFGYLNDNLMLVLGKQRRRVRIGVIALFVNIAGNLALVPEFGYQAAAWMTLATEAVVVLMVTRIVLQELGVQRPNLNRVWRTAGCAVLLGGELAIAQALGAPLWGLIALSCVSYPLLLLALRGMTIADMQTVLRRRAPA
jgi:O-antigen/teichoic acid export membrane protein